MRSRAAILPYPGDPFLLNYWLKFFDTIWGQEIDTLYICLNSPIETAVVEYIREICMKRPQIELTYIPRQIEHGDAIDYMLKKVKEEYLMLIEDDGFIFRKGFVDGYFSKLEDGSFEVIGSKRGSCSQEILDRSKELYGLDYMGEGDQGCNFWPNFFFCKTELLRETDHIFTARGWNPGEEIMPLSIPGDPYIAKDIVASDTFVNTSMQILAKVPQNRILYIPQYHGSPDDIEHYQRSYNLFDGRAPWVHVGSLSSGVGGILQDGKGRSLARRLIDPEKEDGTLPNYCNSEGEKNEWERRVQWWLTFAEYWMTNDSKDAAEEMKQFFVLYRDAIAQIISEYGLNEGRIVRRQNMYKEIGL